MPRKSNLKKLEIENAETGATEELTETKFDNMLSYLREYDDDYYVTLYKKKDRNKRVMVTRFNNELPDPFDDIQQKFGGGEYRLIVHALSKDTGKYEMIDSADLNIEGADITAQPAGQALSSNRQDVINEIKSIGEIFGNVSRPEKNDNEILIKLMEMQNKISENMMKAQQESERRITDLMIASQAKKPALAELMEIAESINSLRGDSEPQSAVEKILSNPMAQNAISVFLGNMNKNNNPPPPPAKPVKQIKDYIQLLPPEYVAEVTKENAEIKVQELYENNKNVIDLPLATNIIVEILKSKGVTSL